MEAEAGGGGGAAPPVAKKLDDETLLLLKKRLAELEVESSNVQNTRLTMASLSLKDLARERFTNRKLVQIAMHEGSMNVGSKALAAQYEHKPDTTHDATASAVRHHTGSHYHGAGSVQFQRG